jgi:hypothetical protein
VTRPHVGLLVLRHVLHEPAELTGLAVVLAADELEELRASD